MDLFEKRQVLKTPLGQHMAYVGDYIYPMLEGPIGPRMHFKGKEMVVWSVNNYLGLANHPAIRAVDAQAAADWGMAYPMGSRLLTGHTAEHEALERALASFTSKEDCFLLNYGYQGVVSIIDSLVDRNDVIVYDEESHACILDGVRLHMGKRFVFKHNNMDSFAQQMEHARALTEKTNGGILVITEGVFGMSGDLGALQEIIAFKTHIPFRLFVDDAHGFGTMGKTGAGTGEALGVQDGIDVYLSTFAKSMASIGAFVSGSKHIIDYLRYSMRSQIFAKALPMAFTVSALERLKLLQEENGLRAKLWDNVKRLQKGLKAQGFNLGQTASPVTPVFLSGSVEESLALNHDLRHNHGIFCSVVVYPVVPKDVIMLRLIPTAAHSTEDVAQTIDAFIAVSKKLGAGLYKTAKATL
jgi:glycine C-acetyltransferase